MCKGLFHHPENAHVGQRNLLSRAGHLRGHEPPGPERPGEKTVWSALIQAELSPCRWGPNELRLWTSSKDVNIYLFIHNQEYK